MKEFIFQTLFFLIVGLSVWFLLDINYYPMLPNWTIPVIAVLLNSILQGLIKIAKLQEDNMELRIMSKLDQIQHQIQQQITDTNTNLGQRITDVETNLGQRITDVETNLGQRITDVETNLGQRITDTSVELKEEFRKEIVPVKQNLRDVVLELTFKETITQTKPIDIIIKK